MKIAKLFLAFMLSLSIFSSTLAAEMVQTREMMNVGQSAKIDDFLAKQEVQEKLAALGVSSSDIKERVAKLTDEEIAQINQKIDELPAGGDVGAAIGVLAFIFIVLLITDILGLTKVFTFTRSVR
ncbi:MAG: PA2779 family protein [Campylobacteraceae bacterium]|jgi:cell division protein FtsB|nr:PA2779 family protein [Campylobacteraceae bacterium]